MKQEKENDRENGGLIASPLYEEAYRSEARKSNVRFFVSLFLVVLIFMLFRGVFVASFARIDVDGSSMLPTLENGDRLFMQFADTGDGGFLRYAKTPGRGDVVIVDVREYHDTDKYKDILAAPFVSRGASGGTQTVNFLVKRLVGLPGDTIKEENGRIYYLTAEQKENGITEYTELEAQPQNVSYALEGCVYELGEGEVLILGDNTYNSTDGRWLQRDKNGNLRSHLKRAYRPEDICGVVPGWAVNCRTFSTKYYAFTDKISALFKKS